MDENLLRVIFQMASPLNLCQHVDNDGTQCQWHNYILCPHCQLELCLKHLNLHQDLLRIDFDILSDQINRLRVHLDQLFFDSNNHRDQLFEQLESCYQQVQTEFDNCKTRKQKQLKENLMRQFQRITAEKQIHVEDLNDMKCKLHDIERGVDELKQSMIELDYDQPTINLQIIKRRYIEATKVQAKFDINQLIFLL